MKITQWIVYEGYCAMRCIEGTDTNNVANRIAFIEKSPRIRIAAYVPDPHNTYLELGGNWKYGPKGAGGSGGEIPENELYGFYPPSREWCDEELKAMGYTW